ncbi:palmitoyltransferase ZDHHC20-A-like [Gigantopelta aegis]|uniref:palmitoyltransferase ZDHHC20-A-like n=1 Tax=Gigantopelta aegis TaxID=1735272 RepID=UPI001B888576|nr:palmitoyltransferase ZDHHC20-A-like [Gigantopelta aegis]
MSVFMRRNAYHQAMLRKRKDDNNSVKRSTARVAAEVGSQSKACWNVQGRLRKSSKRTKESTTSTDPLTRADSTGTANMEKTLWNRITRRLKSRSDSSSKDNKNRRSNILTPEGIESVAVPLFFFTIIATWLIGLVDVLPEIYEEYGSRVLMFQQVFVSVLFSEMMLNWFCIRYVDSSIRTVNGIKRAVRRVMPVKDDRMDSAQLGEQEEEDQSPFTVDSRGVRTYPYWSRSPCFKCDVIRPPRCHHCVLCNICVLKRDHHCFFAGSCIGWRNQRHFIVFCFWAALSCAYAFAHALYFIYYYLWYSISYMDFFVPVTALRCLLGYTSPKMTLYIAVTSFLIYFFIISSNFFIEHMELISAGKTTFEVDRVSERLQIKDTRSFFDKLKGVFGRNPLLNVIFPVHFVFPPLDDPIEWPCVKVHRQP